MTEIVYKSSRGWGIYGAVVSLCFICLGYYFLNHPHGKITALAPEFTVMFSFTLLGSVFQIVRPSKFEISREGFSFSYLFFKVKHSWSEIDDVWLTKRFDYHLLVWRLNKGASRSEYYAEKNEEDYDGVLPIWWRSKQSKIALKMIEALEQHERTSK